MEQVHSEQAGETVRVLQVFSGLIQVAFASMAHKYSQKGFETEFSVGNEVKTKPNWKITSKSPFEQNVLFNLEPMEIILDTLFTQLKVVGEKVNHPIVMTEPVYNPGFSRASMNELLFEAYQVPKVCYGIDALFSLYHNQPKVESATVISSGHGSTFVLPLLKGRLQHTQISKIPFGGSQASEFMLKLMQLKYPTFPYKMSLDQAESVVGQFTYFSLDYKKDLRRFAQPHDYEHDVIIQFPFTEGQVVEKTEEQEKALKEKRRKQGLRLKEQAEKKRNEKLIEKEKELEEYLSLRDRIDDESLEAVSDDMEYFGFKTELELEKAIKVLEEGITRIKCKIMGIEEPEKEKEEPTYDLVDIPDDDLSADQLKEKRKQRLLKNAAEARERIKNEKMEAERQIELKREEDERQRELDPEKWLQEKKDKYQVFCDVIFRLLAREYDREIN